MRSFHLPPLPTEHLPYMSASSHHEELPSSHFWGPLVHEELPSSHFWGPLVYEELPPAHFWGPSAGPSAEASTLHDRRVLSSWPFLHIYIQWYFPSISFVRSFAQVHSRRQLLFSSITTTTTSTISTTTSNQPTPLLSDPLPLSLSSLNPIHQPPPPPSTMGCAFSHFAKAPAKGSREYDDSGNGMYTNKAHDQTPLAAPSWKGKEPSPTFRVNNVDGTYYTSQAYDQRRDAARFQMSQATLDREQEVRTQPTRYELAAGGSEYYNDLRERQRNLRNGK